MPASQPPAGLPTIVAAVALMGGLIWAATRNIRTGAEQRELARKVAELDERTAAQYMDAFLDGYKARRVTP